MVSNQFRGLPGGRGLVSSQSGGLRRRGRLVSNQKMALRRQRRVVATSIRWRGGLFCGERDMPSVGHVMRHIVPGATSRRLLDVRSRPRHTACSAPFPITRYSMRPSNPGAATLRLRNGNLSEDIPAALVHEAILALPSEMPAAKTLRGWHEGTVVGALQREHSSRLSRSCCSTRTGASRSGRSRASRRMRAGASSRRAIWSRSACRLRPRWHWGSNAFFCFGASAPKSTSSDRGTARDTAPGCDARRLVEGNIFR